jgi:hypothetical protein
MRNFVFRTQDKNVDLEWEEVLDRICTYEE